MTRTAFLIAADLLEKASERFSRHVCNDYFLTATPENIAFVRAAQVWGGDGSDVEVRIRGGEIGTYDWLILAYLAHLCRQEGAGLRDGGAKKRTRG